MAESRSIHEYTDVRLPGVRVVERKLEEHETGGKLGDPSHEMLVFADGLIVSQERYAWYRGHWFAEGLLGLCLVAIAPVPE